MDVLSKRMTILLYDLLVVGVLVGLALWYVKSDSESGLQGFFPAALRGTPLFAVWFGALGGAVVSLKNVVAVDDPWKENWSIWFYGKPFLAAVIGGVTYVLLRIVSSNTPNTQVVEAAAFIVGIQEKKFFDLLSKVSEVVLAVPETKEALQVTTVEPSPASAGASVTISGQGFLQGTRVKLGSFNLENVQVGVDGKSLTGSVPSDGSGLVDVLVTNPDGSAYVKPNGFQFG